jgi:hypothetical protein
MFTGNHVNNEIIKFRRQAAFDFLRSSRFDPYMGADSTSIIVRCPTSRRTASRSTSRSSTSLLVMASAPARCAATRSMIDSYGFPVWADWARNAVANNRARQQGVELQRSFDRSQLAARLVQAHRA